jgi:Glycosyltransferase family 87
MADPLRAAVRLAPYLVGALGLLVLVIAAWTFMGSSGFAYDYGAYDSAARRIATGAALYPPGAAEAYNSQSYAGLYLYAPPLAVALVPLMALTPVAAATAWLCFRLLVLLAGVMILPIPARARAATLGVAGLSFPVLYDLNLGNLSIVLFALSALIWRYRDRPLGSVALAVVGTVRYSFAIVLVGWLIRRRVRPVAWTLLGGLAIAAATLPFVGAGAWVDYVRTLTSLHDVSSGPNNVTLGTTAIALGIPGQSILWVPLGLAIALAATAYAALRRDPETAVVVSLAATITFAPFFHPHYLVELLIPAAFLASRGRWWGLALPLLAWLPGAALPVVAIAGILAPLIPTGFHLRSTTAVVAAPGG